MILVIGATGNVGSEVVRGLAAAGASVRALTRDPAKVKVPEGVELAEGDLARPETLAAAVRGVENVFLMARAPHLHEHVRHVVRAAEGAGVRHIVFLSSHAADPESDAPLARWHGEAENELRASRMAWTMVRCGAFATNLLFFAQQVRERGALPSWPSSDARIAVVDPADIAAVATVALTQPGHEEKTYLVTGPESLGMLEQTRILGEVLGRELVYEVLPDPVLLQIAQGLGLAEHAEAFVRQLRADGTGRESHPTSTIHDVTGRAPRTFRQWAHDHANAFR
ncbi:NAD(P)H-binding protein [Pendulispora albinea]|uniref:NAD(P)H-binding protein n=1 Tax=Pendulispora albinea TaxID=2741071 RepID=A0ABZ2MA28_9BACT